MDFSGTEILANLFIGLITAVWVIMANQQHRRSFWAAIYIAATKGFVISVGLQVLCEIICHTEADPPLAAWWQLNFAETCGLGAYFLVALVGTRIVAPGRRDLRALLGK